jgi:hypothetical protein
MTLSNTNNVKTSLSNGQWSLLNQREACCCCLTNVTNHPSIPVCPGAVTAHAQWYGASLGGQKTLKCDILRGFAMSNFINT